MGFVALLALIAAAMGGMALLGLRRPLWSLGGAALMLGATGYALQGRPFLPEQKPRPRPEANAVDTGLIELRERMLGRLTGDWSYLVAADAMRRAGEDKLAVQAILGGIRRVPNSLMLWVGLGEALAEHDGGRVSPSALFAFQQAMRISPAHPAPPFFLGLAYVRSGDFAAARPLWARALALSPAGVSYRQDIALRLALLDRFLAETEGAPGASPPR
jgi:hypothetical protein